MATSKIEMQYDLCQNNAANRPTNGLWYPRAKRLSTLNLRGLAAHIQGHGSIYTIDVVSGVLTKFKECLVELVSQGTGVKIDGIGTFYPTLEAKGAQTPFAYNVNDYVQGVHIRFAPEDKEEDKITSRAFMGKVTMKQHMIFDKYGVPKKIKNGELVDYGTNDDDENDEG